MQRGRALAGEAAGAEEPGNSSSVPISTRRAPRRAPQYQAQCTDNRRHLRGRSCRGGAADAGGCLTRARRSYAPQRPPRPAPTPRGRSWRGWCGEPGMSACGCCKCWARRGSRWPRRGGPPRTMRPTLPRIGRNLAAVETRIDEKLARLEALDAAAERDGEAALAQRLADRAECHTSRLEQQMIERLNAQRDAFLEALSGHLAAEREAWREQLAQELADARQKLTRYGDGATPRIDAAVAHAREFAGQAGASLEQHAAEVVARMRRGAGCVGRAAGRRSGTNTCDRRGRR